MKANIQGERAGYRLQSTPRQKLLDAIPTRALVDRSLPSGPDTDLLASSGLLFTNGCYDVLHSGRVRKSLEGNAELALRSLRGEMGSARRPSVNGLNPTLNPDAWPPPWVRAGKKYVPLEFSMLRVARQALAFLLALILLFPAYPQSLLDQDQQAQAQAPSGPPYMQQTPEQLQQLVAPIALYPDSLVAQILAASTFPEEVVDADRWVQSHPDLKGEALAQAVDQMPWDPSVKALVAFPSVLGNMDKNLSWTSSLGDAYYNQEQGVMDAVQAMRRRAQQAGNLNSTTQQVVTTEGSDIQIEPASPEIVYVPAYDPWIVYGGPIVEWPGWYPYPGIWYDGPSPFFGGGFGIGFFGHYGWGWHHWDSDWHHHHAVFDHERYYSPSRTFYDRDRFYRGGGARDFYTHAERAPRPAGGDRGGARGVYNRPERAPQPFGGDRGTARGYAAPRGQSGVRSGAFSGYGHGGEERGFSSRGSSSFGGGGFHGGGGGGGFHGGGAGGGGFHGGGGHR